jgi:DNA-binding XRE family transcriptional regulator
MIGTHAIRQEIMLTSNIQYRASKKAAEQLRLAIDAPVNPGVSEKMAEANKQKMRYKLAEIEAEIAEYERLREMKTHEIQINSLEDMLLAPIAYRLARQETVDEFAREIGVNKRQILRYESEKYQNCSIPTLQQILSKIGLKIHGHLDNSNHSV